MRLRIFGFQEACHDEWRAMRGWRKEVETDECREMGNRLHDQGEGLGDVWNRDGGV